MPRETFNNRNDATFVIVTHLSDDAFMLDGSMSSFARVKTSLVIRGKRLTGLRNADPAVTANR